MGQLLMPAPRITVNLKLTVAPPVGQGPPTSGADISDDVKEAIIQEAHDRIVDSINAAVDGVADRPSPTLAGVRGRPY